MTQDNSEEWIKSMIHDPTCPKCGADNGYLIASVVGIWNTDMKDWSFDYFNTKLICNRCYTVTYYERS